MTPAEQVLFKKIHMAVCDPGAYVSREREVLDGVTEYESVTHWSARAVMAVLPEYEKQVRERLADEIANEDRDPCSDYERGLIVAENIARGGA